MSIVHSCEETQTANLVIGGEPGRLSSRHSRSAVAAPAFATPGGADLSGGSTPWVSSSFDTNSRNTTASPSVTKYTPPAGALVAPSQSPSTVLSTCVVAVRWLPPPTQRKRPA